MSFCQKPLVLLDLLISLPIIKFINNLPANAHVVIYKLLSLILRFFEILFLVKFTLSLLVKPLVDHMA